MSDVFSSPRQAQGISDAGQRSTTAWIRQAYRDLHLERAKQSSAPRQLLSRLKAILRPAKYTWLFGRAIEAQGGPGLARQFAGQLKLLRNFDIQPLDYYRYRLHEKESDDQILGFLTRTEAFRLLRHLGEGAAADDYRTLHDKRLFFRHCQRWELPTVAILAEFNGGEASRDRAEISIGAFSGGLISKPTFGHSGRGVERWRALGAGRFEDSTGVALSERELWRHLLLSSRNGPDLILQECLANHSQVARLSGEGLCTIRVVTCQSPDGGIEHLLSVFRMATGDSPADNFAQGGIASPVNPITGVLAGARSRDPLRNRSPMDRHPDTGTPIAGFEIPYWEESSRLAKRAHATFEKVPFVGWDIAVLEDGLIVLEGNPVWCVELAQIPPDQPILHTKFGRYLRHHLERRDLERRDLESRA